VKFRKKGDKSFSSTIFACKTSLIDKIQPVKVASFIANRIAFNRQRSFSRFIIRLSIVATTISVAVMIVTLAFTNGFQETVSQKIFSFWGHVRVQYKQPMKSTVAEEEQIEKNDTVVQLIRQNPNVVSIHPFCNEIRDPEDKR
jgi:lipoprotein-releasing system permease protein